MNRSLIYRERDYKIKLFIKPYYKRNLNEHLNLSFCLLDKPKGPTSHEVAAWIKRMINVPTAHSGTLGIWEKSRCVWIAYNSPW
ncbi:MAG: hypothetical protein RXR31_07635 [Thermoproteota archaeon]|jgi:tRNA pseudouridine synthase B (EC 4.2.1.70)